MVGLGECASILQHPGTREKSDGSKTHKSSEAFCIITLVRTVMNRTTFEAANGSGLLFTFGLALPFIHRTSKDDQKGRK